MPDTRERQGYHLGLPHFKISGNLIRNIIQLLYGLLDFSARCRFNGARVVNDAGHSSHSYAS